MSRFVFLILLVLPAGVAAQQVFEHITTSHGLSNNVIHSVLQDKQGFYWISTTDGLNRFDGSAFKVFRHQKNDPHSISNNYCTSLAEDRDGDIWIATYNGISVHRKKEGRFQNIFLHHKYFKPDILNRISYVGSDKFGNMWAASHGFWKFDRQGNILQSYFHDPDDKTSINDGGAIVSVVIDNFNKGIWALTSGSLNFFDLTTESFFHANNNPKNWKIFKTNTVGLLAMDSINRRLWYYNNEKKAVCFFDLVKFQEGHTALPSPTLPRAMQTDHRGRVWVSYWKDSDTTLIFDPANGTINHDFLNKFHSFSSISRRFNGLYSDRVNNIWISSNRGISVYDQSNQFFSLYELDDLNLINNNPDPLSIWSISPARDGTIWFGCNKKGLFRFDTKSRKHYIVNKEVIDDYIRSIYLQNDSILWCISAATVFKFDIKANKVLKKMKLDNGLHFITGDKFGHIWVGDWFNGLYKLNYDGERLKHYLREGPEPVSLPINNLICFNNRFDEFWIGLNGAAGFVKYDYSTDRFFRFIPAIQDLSGGEFGTINSIATADKTNYVIGTHGGGIYLWNRQTNTYTHFDRSDGIDGNFINSVLTDKNGNFWIGTSNGVNFFDSKTQKFNQLKVDFAFRTNAFRKNGEEGPNGNLFMFCGNKIIEINPSLYNISNNTTKTLLSSFKVFDKDLTSLLTDSVIHLTHKQNYFSFEYSALKINPGSAVKYAYQLKGFDQDWHDAGDRRYASYTNVPAGAYRFMVKSTNEKGDWSENVAGIRVVISPPFWKTFWFISLVALILIGGIFSLYRYRIVQLKRFHSLRSKISQDLHDDVGATLSGIKVFSQLAKERPEASQQFLEKINTYSNEMLNRMSDIVWSINTENDSLEHLIDRLRGYALTITSAKNITLEFFADPEIKRKVPDITVRKNLYLIAKEAINNAVKYAECTLIQITLKAERSGIKLTIFDNGKGFNKNIMNGGNGLSNMKKRTEELNGTFLLDTTPAKGTLIAVNFNFT